MTIGIDIDDTQANQKLVTLQSKVDRQVQQWRETQKLVLTETVTTNVEIDNTVRRWREQRTMILTQMSQISQGISLMLQSIRLTASITGERIIPAWSMSILSLISNTTSVLLSTAAAVTAGSFGILAGVGLAISLIAL